MVHCKECGDRENPEKYAVDTCNRMSERSLCWTCLYWTDVVERYLIADPALTVINGVVYSIGQEDGTKPQGFGGIRYKIHYFNGKRRVTTNLWHIEPVPERFRGRLKDNASFSPPSFRSDRARELYDFLELGREDRAK